MSDRMIVARPHLPGAGAFRQSILDHLDERRKSQLHLPKQKLEAAMNRLAREVSGLADDDPRLATLWYLQKQRGERSETFAPGPQQRRLIGLAGTSIAPDTSGDDLLDELIYHGACDLREALVKQAAGEAEKARAEAKRSATQKLEPKLVSAQDKAEAAEARARKAERERDEMRKQRDEAIALLPSDEFTVPGTKPERRQRASTDHVNVYVTDKADGSTVYEVRVGKRGSFEKFDSLEEALARRDERREEKGLPPADDRTSVEDLPESGVIDPAMIGL